MFAVPRALEDLVAVVQFAREKGLPLKMVGNGSNLLVGDGGIRGIVVRLTPNFSEVQWREDGVVVGAGMRLQALLHTAMRQGRSGLESLVSIPGTVGGALVMNAGTDVGTIGDLVTGATVVDERGEVLRVRAEELGYRYRHSQLRSGKWVVVEAELRLTRAPSEEIQAKMDRLRLKREGRQPLRRRGRPGRLSKTRAEWPRGRSWSGRARRACASGMRRCRASTRTSSLTGAPPGRPRCGALDGMGARPRHAAVRD